MKWYSQKSIHLQFLLQVTTSNIKKYSFHAQKKTLQELNYIVSTQTKTEIEDKKKLGVTTDTSLLAIKDSLNKVFLKIKSLKKKKKKKSLKW